MCFEPCKAGKRFPRLDGVGYVVRTAAVDGLQNFLHVHAARVKGSMRVAAAIVVVQVKVREVRSQTLDPLCDRKIFRSHCVGVSDIQTKADARIIDLPHHIDEHIRFVLQHVFNTKDVYKRQDVTDAGLVLKELAPGITAEYVQERTQPELILSDDLKEMEI